MKGMFQQWDRCSRRRRTRMATWIDDGRTKINVTAKLSSSGKRGRTWANTKVAEDEGLAVPDSIICAALSSTVAISRVRNGLPISNSSKGAPMLAMFIGYRKPRSCKCVVREIDGMEMESSEAGVAER